MYSAMAMRPFVIPSRDDDLLELSLDIYYVSELKEDLKEVMRGVRGEFQNRMA